jgi:hypothetical protein
MDGAGFQSCEGQEFAVFFQLRLAAGTWSWPPPSTAEVKKESSYNSTPAVSLYGLGRDSFNFLLVSTEEWNTTEYLTMQIYRSTTNKLMK